MAGSASRLPLSRYQNKEIRKMAVPKKKISRARGRKRRAQAFKLGAPSVPKGVVPGEQGLEDSRFACPECGHVKEPHKICPNCGFYQGRSLEIER
jgi:large subunit ribosomal protein L32